jgi:hypothetical protein
MTGLLAAPLALILVLLAVLSGPAPAFAQTGTQAPTTPGGAGQTTPGAPGRPAPGAPGQIGEPGPLGQPQEAVRPTPSIIGTQVFDFLGFSFGETGGLVPGYYVLPSFTVSGTYDDNIFLESSNRRDDFITRFTPAIGLGYISTPFTILGSYAFDVEIYAKETDFNNVGDRQRAELRVRYLPNPRLTLSLDGGFARSNDPADINRQGALERRRGATPSSVPVTEIQRGREETTSLTLSPRVSYQFTPLWTGDASYTFALTEGEGTDVGTSHTFALGASRVLSARDTGSVGYTFTIFDTDGTDTDGTDTTTAHSITVGWTRRVSELLNVGARLGPSFTDDGDVDVDAGFTVNYRLGTLTDLSVIYARSQALVTGRAGSSTVDAVTTAIRTRPLEFLTVSAGPTYTRISGNGGNGDVSIYGLDAGASYQITRWLSAGATYRFSYQEGSGGNSNGDIFHNTITIGLTVTQAIRVY